MMLTMRIQRVFFCKLFLGKVAKASVRKREVSLDNVRGKEKYMNNYHPGMRDFLPWIKLTGWQTEHKVSCRGRHHHQQIENKQRRPIMSQVVENITIWCVNNVKRKQQDFCKRYGGKLQENSRKISERLGVQGVCLHATRFVLLKFPAGAIVMSLCLCRKAPYTILQIGLPGEIQPNPIHPIPLHMAAQLLQIAPN